MKERDKLSRRKFLGVAGASTLAAGRKIACAGQISESSESIPVAGEYDVIVCGGGASGLPAAVAAARQGAKMDQLRTAKNN